MWNSPSDRQLVLRPKDILALCLTIDLATEIDFCGSTITIEESPYYVSEPFCHVPPRILVYESYRLMHTLVTKTPAPEEGHNAIEEALLYDVLQHVLDVGIDCSNEDPNTADVYISTINHLLRRAGRRKRVKAPIKLRQDYWEESVLDTLFFWDRDWQFGAREMAALAVNPAFRHMMDISDRYYGAQLSIPTDDQLRHARSAFLQIYECAEEGKPIPQNMPAIESLEQVPVPA